MQQELSELFEQDLDKIASRYDGEPGVAAAERPRGGRAARS
jgi:hypothetical protein